MKTRRRKFFIFSNLFLFLFTAIWFVPTIALFVSSFRLPADLSVSGWWNAFLHPDRLTLSNYKLVLFQSGIARAFLNSLIISIPSTIIPVAVASLAAYSFAFMEFPFRKTLFITILALQVIPLQITLIPTLVMLKDLRLAGTFPGLWLAHSAYGLPFGIYLLHNFFSKIPSSILESAQMDGASHRQIFLKIILPLSVPALASLAIFQFLWVWNDLLIALVYLGGTPDVAPLTIRIAGMKGSLESGWHIMTTAAFISMVLPLAVFFALQKYFVRGILAGAVKE